MGMFVRWERERERGGGGGGRDGSREMSSKRNWLEGPHWIKDTGVLTYDWRPHVHTSWRLTSTRTRTHSLSRTLVFRGFTSRQLGSSSLTLGMPVDTAFMTSHGHHTSSELPPSGANSCANRVNFSLSESHLLHVQFLLFGYVPRSGWKCQRSSMNKPAHVSRLWGYGGRREGTEESRRAGYSC